jgi:membrane protein
VSRGRRGLPATVSAVASGVRSGLSGRDLALISAGLTFYAGIAIVPLMVLAFGLTAWLTSAERVRVLGDRLAELLPGELGAPAAVARLVEAGVGLDPWAPSSPWSRCPSTARACGAPCCGSAPGTRG